MTDAGYTGFRFSFSRRSVNAPGGTLTVSVLAVAKNDADALKAALDVLPETPDLTLLSSGDEDLKEARLLGIPDGAAKIIP